MNNKALRYSVPSGCPRGHGHGGVQKQSRQTRAFRRLKLLEFAAAEDPASRDDQYRHPRDIEGLQNTFPRLVTYEPRSYTVWNPDDPCCGSRPTCRHWEAHAALRSHSCSPSSLSLFRLSSRTRRCLMKPCGNYHGPKRPNSTFTLARYCRPSSYHESLGHQVH